MFSQPVPLGFAHRAQCLALSVEAGWNQNEADWSFILQHGLVLGISRADRVVATAGVVPYGRRFGWICMVLVTASERRKGLASLLMRRCIEWLQERGAIAGLDATPAGREVYRKLGFADVYPITRLQRISAAVGNLNSEALEPVASIGAGELSAISEYDREFFGEDRGALLRHLFARVPTAAFRIRPHGGYVLARDGRLATQIGPLLASSSADAVKLLNASLDALSGPVFIDVPDRHANVLSFLMERGFSVQRTFTRMLFGRSEPLDRSDHIFAITGPEFG